MLMTLNSTLKKKKKKGFTLIELIIVIAIIAILAAIAIPRFVGVRRDANISADRADAKTIQNAVSALDARGDITRNDTGNTVIHLGSSVTTGEEHNYSALSSYLQTIPTPKAVTGVTYIVTINADGTVHVAAGTTEILPSPVSPY